MKRITDRSRYVALVLGALGLAGCGASLGLRHGNSTLRNTSNQTYGGLRIVYEHGIMVVLQRERRDKSPSPDEWKLALCRAHLIDEFYFLWPIAVKNYTLDPFANGQLPYNRRFVGESDMPRISVLTWERQIPKSFLECKDIYFQLNRLTNFAKMAEHSQGSSATLNKNFRGAKNSLYAVVALQSSTDRDVGDFPVKALKMISRAGTPGHPKNLIAVAVNTPYWTMVLDMANSTDPKFLEQARVISEVKQFGKKPHKILEDLLKALSTIKLPEYMKGPDNGPKFLEKLETISFVAEELRKPETREVIAEIKQIVEDIITDNADCETRMRTPEKNYVKTLRSIIKFEFIMCDPRIEADIRALPQERRQILFPPGNPGAANDSADFDQEVAQRFVQDSAACNLVIDKICEIVNQDNLVH